MLLRVKQKLIQTLINLSFVRVVCNVVKNIRGGSVEPMQCNMLGLAEY